MTVSCAPSTTTTVYEYTSLTDAMVDISTIRLSYYYALAFYVFEIKKLEFYVEMKDLGGSCSFNITNYNVPYSALNFIQDSKLKIWNNISLPFSGGGGGKGGSAPPPGGATKLMKI